MKKLIIAALAFALTGIALGAKPSPRNIQPGSFSSPGKRESTTSQPRTMPATPAARSISKGPRFPEAFPQEWREKKFIDTDYKNLRPGVDYYWYHFEEFYPGQPLSIHYIVVQWDIAHVGLRVGLAPEGSVERVQDMVARECKKNKQTPVAAVNGAYFTTSAPFPPYFVVKGNGTRMDPPPEKKNEGASAGFASKGFELPVLLRGNNASIGEQINDFENYISGYNLASGGVNNRGTFMESNDRTPYTALGIDAEKKLFVIMVNDGRHKLNSPGIAFNDIANFIFAAGAKDMVSIDGGGSSTMLLGKKLELVNYPSDNGKFDHEGARRVQSCVYLVEE